MIVFVGSNFYSYNLSNDNIRTVASFSPTQSVSGIIHRQNLVNCNCVENSDALGCDGLDGKLIIVFGNHLCKIL
ncbi:unnamed protein product, partial [Hymenolepis diminuta]